MRIKITRFDGAQETKVSCLVLLMDETENLCRLTQYKLVRRLAELRKSR